MDHGDEEKSSTKEKSSRKKEVDTTKRRHGIAVGMKAVKERITPAA
jgi:hypothetical protein